MKYAKKYATKAKEGLSDIPVKAGYTAIKTVLNMMPRPVRESIMGVASHIEERQYNIIRQRIEDEINNSTNDLVRGTPESLQRFRIKKYGDKPYMFDTYETKIEADQFRPPIVRNSRLIDGSGLGMLALRGLKKEHQEHVFREAHIQGARSGISMITCLGVLAAVLHNATPGEMISLPSFGEVADIAKSMGADITENVQSGIIDTTTSLDSFLNEKRELVNPSNLMGNTSLTMLDGKLKLMSPYAIDYSHVSYSMQDLYGNITETVHDVMDDANAYMVFYDIVTLLVKLASASLFLGIAGYFAYRNVFLNSALRGFAPVINRANMLNYPTKDSILGYANHMADYHQADLSYIDQRKLNDYFLTPNDMSKMFFLGVSTGTALMRNAPSINHVPPGHLMGVDLEGAGSGFGFLGETGTGKTRAMLGPMAIQAAAMGHGAYITDAKAALWIDIKKALEKMASKGGVDRTADLRVIGPEPEQYGVDLLRGMNPEFAANMIVVCSSPENDAKSGDFFDTAGGKLLYGSTVYAYLLNNLEARKNYTKKYKMGVYTIGFIAKLLKDADLRLQVEADIIDAMINRYSEEGYLCEGYQFDSVFTYFNEEVKKYEQSENMWMSVVATVKENILAPYMQLSDSMKDKFIFCNTEKMIDVNQALEGKIVCNAINMTADPNARALSVMLKSRLMILASERQIKFSKEGKEVRGYAPMCMLSADEYQDLVTVTKKIESDYSFPNRARSTGVYYCIGVQSYAALTMAAGDKASKNTMSVVSTMVVLPTKDKDTFDAFASQIGETIRYHTGDKNIYENFWAMLAANPDLANIDNLFDEIKAVMEHTSMSTRQVPFSGRFDEIGEFHEPDFKLANRLSSIHTGERDTATDVERALHEAKKEANDKIRTLMTTGNDKEALVKHTELNGSQTRSIALIVHQNLSRRKVDVAYVGANSDYIPGVTPMPGDVYYMNESEEEEKTTA